MNELAPGSWVGLHSDEVAVFKKHLAGKTGSALEIGCCDGFSSRIILESSEYRLLSIDPFIPDSMAPSLIGQKERYLHNVADFGDRAMLKVDFSHNVFVNEWHGYELDFLFIDGDHTYDAVLQDFMDWSRHVKVGGLLAMHDSRMGRGPGAANFHPGPSRVAHEEIFSHPNKWKVVDEAFSLVLAQKL